MKLRLPNSGQNLSKANGFRLIYLIHKEKKSIILLDIYPKRGNHKKNSIDKAEINRLLANYVNEGESLQLHNINSELLEMVEA
ncbi:MULTISPECIES: hypothetical protein [unclassified Parabacteroides]|uniref:hypothetical protein n=1 Tax=unclassified Parabacteroides TaxID=2649774 RepID=UPI00247576E7|nr:MULTISPECIES: hypothetical protein [unclassified Parabacteroides]